MLLGVHVAHSAARRSQAPPTEPLPQFSATADFVPELTANRIETAQQNLPLDFRPKHSCLRVTAVLRVSELMVTYGLLL